MTERVRVLSTRELNRALLARQLLLERSKLPLTRALEQVAGLQTQYAPSAYVSLWSRLADFRPDALTRALEQRRAVQATLMRATIHVVSARDFPLFAAAIRNGRREWWLRGQRKALEGIDMEAVAARVRHHLADGPRRASELQALLDTDGHPRIAAVSAGMWLDIVRVPPSGTWDSRRADLYGLADDWLGPSNATEAEGLERLVRRYLGGFGPASLDNLVSWTGLPPTTLRPVVERLPLRRFRDEQGGELLDLPRAPLPHPDTPAPVRFLPTWDATLLAHARRTQILPEPYRLRVFNTKTPTRRRRSWWTGRWPARGGTRRAGCGSSRSTTSLPRPGGSSRPRRNAWPRSTEISRADRTRARATSRRRSRAASLRSSWGGVYSNHRPTDRESSPRGGPYLRKRTKTQVSMPIGPGSGGGPRKTRPSSIDRRAVPMRNPSRRFKMGPWSRLSSRRGGAMAREKDAQEAQVSEAQIAVHWPEEEYYYPPAKFIAQANAADPAIFERFSEAHFPECFKEYADLLTWDAYWHTTLDTSNAPFWKWFVGGRLNASYNCVDRHLATSRNKAAFIWVPEPETEDIKAITYQELYKRINEFAALLRDFGDVKVGDRVTFHLPMVPELPVSMLACARLGVIHSEVFGGFSGAACGDRIADSGSHILVTMDGYYRNGELIDHKAKADEALAAASERGVEVDKVLVWRRHPGQYASKSPMAAGRDFFVDELLQDYRGKVVEPVSMPAEAPLFLMYTSGTTARPKGCEHSTGGYLAYVTGTSKYYQDIHPEDTYWCFADIGWITGHSYIVYGPLALGTTSVMYEGVPTYPDPGRPWRIAERLGVNIFHTAPTTIRMLRKLGPDEPKKYNYHFKHMTTVGEPIEPDVWRWYHEVVGKGEAVIVDTWWQTENGGFLGSTLPALQSMKPGSCGPGVLGIYPVIYDEDHNVVEAGSGRAGNICIRNPWPGIFQTVWGQPERFVQIYYEKYCRDKNSKDWRDWPYLAGDGAVQGADGYFRILGRIDDVINVAGHRLGTKELESASITVEEIAEAAAVPVMDELRGRAAEMYVSLKPGLTPSKDIEEKVAKAIETQIGKIARPKNVWIVPDMPKTRSGKIMRRVIAGISNFADVGDTTTLSNPEVVEDIRQHVQSEKLARGEVPRELSPQEMEEIKAFGRAE